MKRTRTFLMGTLLLSAFVFASCGSNQVKESKENEKKECCEKKDSTGCDKKCEGEGETAASDSTQKTE